MKKILFRSIVLCLVITAFVMFAVCLGVVFIEQSKGSFKGLSEMLEQVEISYENSKLVIEEKEEMFKEDYLNRAYAIRYILENNPEQSCNASTLKKIKELMEVESIHILDDRGTIIYSSDEKSIGLDLREYQEASPFWKLIESKDLDANVVQLDGIKILGQENQIYIGVKSNSELFSVVQIGLNPSVLENLLASDTIASIVNKTPTIYEKTIFLIDKESGEIEGITRNNEQDLNFANVHTKEEFIAILQEGKKGRIVKINGSLKYLKTKEIGNKIIGAYVQAEVVFNAIRLQFLELCSVVVLIIMSAWMSLNHYVKKYILKDLFSIEFNIKQLIEGCYDITFETDYNTELRKICGILNDWKDSYKTKAERMSRIISTIDGHVAVFECLYSINQNFFSDNIQSILSIDDNVWNEIKSTPKGFERYVKYLNSTAKNDDGIIEVNGRYISIASFHSKDEFYGMILDNTEDEVQMKQIKQALHNVQEKAETDPLTKLMNRGGLEKNVKQYLENNSEKGIMLIFDLDNFKSVNDALGHPEGDKLLKKFAVCLASSFRKHDVIARLGGDEFAVFMDTELSKEVLCNKLNSLLENIRSELSFYYHTYGVSTSIGVAFVDNLTSTYEDLYQCADVALYGAKKLGKDRFYINEENIRCMGNECSKCTKNCKKRERLDI